MRLAAAALIELSLAALAVSSLLLPPVALVRDDITFVANPIPGVTTRLRANDEIDTAAANASCPLVGGIDGPPAAAVAASCELLFDVVVSITSCCCCCCPPTLF